MSDCQTQANEKNYNKILRVESWKMDSGAWFIYVRQINKISVLYYDIYQRFPKWEISPPWVG